MGTINKMNSIFKKEINESLFIKTSVIKATISKKTLIY